MNNLTTIAITNTYNDTVSMLPPAATLPDIGNVIFHGNPRLEFTGSDMIKNFDYHFDFNIKKNRLHENLLGDRYFHHPRQTRMTQYINITHFNETREPRLRLFIPDYYLATERHHEHVYMTNFGLPKGDKVVIKEALGARGSNQMVVPTNMVTTLLKHSKGLNMAEIKTKFPDFIYSDGTDWDKIMFTKPSDIFISELVTGVKVEWRLLVGGGNIYGRERTIKQGPYPQANLDHDVFVAVPEVKYEPIENMFDATLAKTLHELVEHLDLPLGSVDLFLTEDGRYGIFEYSTQFAFMGADNQFIRQMLLDGISKGISRRNKTGFSNNQLKGVFPTAPVRPLYTNEIYQKHGIMENDFRNQTIEYKLEYVPAPNVEGKHEDIRKDYLHKAIHQYGIFVNDLNVKGTAADKDFHLYQLPEALRVKSTDKEFETQIILSSGSTLAEINFTKQRVTIVLPFKPDSIDLLSNQYFMDFAATIRDLGKHVALTTPLTDTVVVYTESLTKKNDN